MIHVLHEGIRQRQTQVKAGILGHAAVPDLVAGLAVGDAGEGMDLDRDALLKQAGLHPVQIIHRGVAAADGEESRRIDHAGIVKELSHDFSLV